MSSGTVSAAEVLDACAGEADPAFRRRTAWALSALAVAGGERVLEIGCGRSPVLGVAGRLRPVTSVGVDVAFDRLVMAARSGFTGALVAADATSLPFRDRTFDRVVACEVLEHLDDDRAALAEARRVALDDALAAVTVPHARYPASWDPLARLLEAVGVQPPRTGWYVGIWYGHRRLYTATALRAVAAAAGWETVGETLLVRGSIPFAHFLLYGVGRRLLDAGLVGRRAAAAVGRTAAAGPLPPWWHPVGAAVRILRAADARAERRGNPGRAVHAGALLRPAGPSARGGADDHRRSDRP